MKPDSQPPNHPRAMAPLTIAIDYDCTWTADPTGWRAWYEIMVVRGHTVILATGRKGWSDDMSRAGLPEAMPIVYCGSELKESVTRRQGWAVNIWIDDMPGMIQDCRMIGGDL